MCVVPECHPYLHQHDEAHEEGEEGYSQQEELPAVFTAEHGGVHVDYGCHKAFDTHELMGRERREREGGVGKTQVLGSLILVMGNEEDELKVGQDVLPGCPAPGKQS